MFSFTGNETSSLRNYLLSRNGFLIVDNGAAEYDDGKIDECIRKNIIHIFKKPDDKSEIVPWFRPLPRDHSVYHCFFDLDGPPPGTIGLTRQHDTHIYGIYISVPFLRDDGRQQLDQKLIGLYTPQGYSRSWSDSRNTEQMKMGVNLVVYSLTRYKEMLTLENELVSERRFLQK